MAQKKGKGIPEDTKKEIRKLFQYFDKDGNGFVSTTELERGLRLEGNNPTKTEIDEVLSEFCLKRGQTLDYDQFEKCVEKYYDFDKLGKDAEEARLKNAFRIFDKDKNGTIEIKELKTVLTTTADRLTDAEVEAMFKEADKNKDGRIQYEEFTKLLLKGVKAKKH